MEGKNKTTEIKVSMSPLCALTGGTANEVNSIIWVAISKAEAVLLEEVMTELILDIQPQRSTALDLTCIDSNVEPENSETFFCCGLIYLDKTN